MGELPERAAYALAPADFMLALAAFLERFEATFGDADWPTTQDNLADAARGYFIAPGGTFLEPGVADEAANWGNRGALLAAYRALRAELERRDFRAPIVPESDSSEI